MIDSTFTLLIQHTYVRSHLVYRISLLGEFFDFIFFTEDSSVVNSGAIDRFASQREESQQDVDFLKALPQTFMDVFTHDSFHEKLHDMSEELQKLPILSITVPVKFQLEQTDVIGEWVRKTLDNNIMLDISIDTGVSVGCRFVWKDILHDFSLEHYRHLHEKELHTQLMSSIATHA